MISFVRGLFTNRHSKLEPIDLLRLQVTRCSDVTTTGLSISEYDVGMHGHVGATWLSCWLVNNSSMIKTTPVRIN